VAESFAEAFDDWRRCPDTGDDAEYRRAAQVALQQECLLLADALALLTHEFEPAGRDPAFCARCPSRVDAAVHHTVRWLRRRYGLGV